MKTTLDELQAFRRGRCRLDHRRGRAAGPDRVRHQPQPGRLEEKLGTTLLRRTTRRLELTEEGEVFLAARGILAAVDGRGADGAAASSPPAGCAWTRPRRSCCTWWCIRRRPQVELELHSNRHHRPDRTPHRRGHPHRPAARLHPARARWAGRRQLVASPAYLQARGKPRSRPIWPGTLLGFNQPEPSTNGRCTQDGSLLHIAPAVASSSGETLRQLALAGRASPACPTS
jgi:DNA-binding transcriptional LysR family regulator